ncbi:MAG: hypothetical protein GQ569_05355 [Methylococcaceae bacterium]|nr:hypothetical protein [Methylococcaceae bacterium]
MKIEEGLRNRVVGAVIVTVLAMIFLPMLLNDPKEEGEQQISSELDIPQKPLDSPSLTATILPDNAEDVLEPPAIADTSLNSQDSTTITEEEKLLEPPTVNHAEEAVIVKKEPINSHQLTTPKPPVVTVAPTTITKPKKLEPPRLDAPPKSTHQAGRWFVQVASFSEQKNANSLRDKLRRQGFSAAVESVWSKKGRIYKLRVGPELDRQRAEMTRNKLNSLNNVKSIVVSN